MRSGLPADKLYSHQILPRVNSSWNHQLFATDATIGGQTAWKQGLNMYGGSTDSDWVRSYLAQQKITDYGVPEFHPQASFIRPFARLLSNKARLEQYLPVDFE